MTISQTNALERVARVLAGMRLSINGEGASGSAGAEVDDAWRDHLDEAVAVLNALREPDRAMAAVGDADTWTRMVRAALGEEGLARPAAPSRSWSGEGETYQKPLG